MRVWSSFVLPCVVNRCVKYFPHIFFVAATFHMENVVPVFLDHHEARNRVDQILFDQVWSVVCVYLYQGNFVLGVELLGKRCEFVGYFILFTHKVQNCQADSLLKNWLNFVLGFCRGIDDTHGKLRYYNNWVFSVVWLKSI